MKQLLNESIMLFIITVIISLININLAEQTILEKIKENSDLSRFYSLVEQNDVAKSTISTRSVTIFIPTNDAFQKFRGNLSESLLLYHLVNYFISKDEFSSNRDIPSDADGNPKLYITKSRNGNVYINHALLIGSRSQEVSIANGKKQVFHVIDEVLEPLLVLPSRPLKLKNPKALQLLTNAESLNIDNFQIKAFRTRVNLMKKENMYQEPGAHTFLIPIDEGFKTSTRSVLVDQKVIDGHVIINNPLFTTAAPLETPHITAAYEDNIKVSVSFFEQGGKMYVKSNTIIGDSKHHQGSVISEIVKANIPVENGVVHLIKRPLMIIDQTVQQFLEDEQNSALYKFYEVIMDMGGDVLADITGNNPVTILAPSNDAWKNANIANVLRNRSKMREILNMHIIKDNLDVAKIRQQNANRINQVPTVSNRTFLYFNIYNDDGNETITVEGGGVNATLLQTDVTQTNGFVHIIDRVLGVPYTTVLGKLSTDPMLNSTYFMGSLSTFNQQLNLTNRRYTYFVSRDKGWEKIMIEWPSTYKKLFMRDYAYHSRALLERHLVIDERAYTMQQLAQESYLANDEIILPTYRDSLKFRVYEEAGRYYIKWNMKKFLVFRADVECTNGIIHVLDLPLLEEKDIQVPRGATSSVNSINTNASAAFILNLILVSLCFNFKFLF